jgi:hypothetical protein
MKKMARVTNEQSNGFTKDLGETTSVCKLMNNYEMLDKATTSSSTLKVSRYLFDDFWINNVFPNKIS